MNKSVVRKDVLKIRNNLESTFVSEASKKIFEKIKSTNILDFNSFLAYSDFKNEVKTDLLINYLKANGREVYLPKCKIDDKSFIPVRLTEKEMKKNLYGIYEPEYNKSDSDAEIDCVILPGVAFDKKGNRIGFGAGYYDKFLEKNPSIYKIGLCYEFQLYDEISSDLHDVPVDALITEKRIIYIK